MRTRRLEALIAGAILALLVILVAGAPLIADLLNLDPSEVDLLARYQPASLAHPLGTDDLGRDVLLRLLYGGRVSLAVGFAAAAVATTIGAAIGLLAGYFGGQLDAMLMRFTDGVISLPLLPLLIVLAAVDLSKLGLAELAVSESASLYRIVAITALVGWTTVARLMRAATQVLLHTDFVRSAQALGAGPWRLMLVHILPNAITPIIVATSLAVGNVILFESVLSFLSFGIQPPLPSWGNMLINAQEVFSVRPMLAVWPGLMIVLTVASCNLLGDALQEALDPRRRRRA